MKKHTGYIVLAVAGSIYIGFNFIVSSYVVYLDSERIFKIGNTLAAEVVTFIPVAALFIVVQVLYKKYRQFFNVVTFKSVGFHVLVLTAFCVIHAVWQVFFNYFLLSADLDMTYIQRDIIIFLNLRLLIYFIAIALAVGIAKIEEREDKLLQQSELKLQLQRTSFRELELKLSPAVIYPNLNYIKTHACDRPDDTSRLVQNLSKQLRILIDSLDEERIPVKRDIQFFEHYFEALQLRLDRKLSVQTNVDPNVLNTRIPSLVLLVPLFEELFFGKYSSRTRNVERVLYRSKKADEGFVNLCIHIKPVLDVDNLKEKLDKEEKLADINFRLKDFEESSLITTVTKDDLSFNLKMNLA